MFAKRCGRAAMPLVSSQLAACGGALKLQTRQAASLKAVQIRMKAVANIQKITKAMKMVAAAKLRHTQRALDNGLPYVQPVEGLFERLPRETKPGTMTYLAFTSDKGLCGGVNSAVNKQCRLGILDEEAKGNAVKYMCIGGKGIAGMKRLYGDRFVRTFEECAKLPWSFSTACLIAERVVEANPGRLTIVANRFKTLVAYDTEELHTVTLDEVQKMDRGEWSKAMDSYEFEPAIFEVWQDLHEFYYAAVIYGTFLNAATTEMANRMTAMDNASKNASEMLEKLALVYNRARQAKITTELCEIISGAAAV